MLQVSGRLKIQRLPISFGNTGSLAWIISRTKCEMNDARARYEIAISDWTAAWRDTSALTRT
jgi:hypothetical protein